MSTIEEFKDGKADDETVNIVVLCDGTLNRPTIETNVYKLHMLLLSEVNEVKTRDISDLETWFKELKKRNREYQETYVIPNDAFRHNDHYYEAGVGERIDLIDTVTADDIDYKIKSAYRHIVQRYNDDQNKSKPKEIWLFGFSRGAYTARCVAGMITNCGILKYDSVELMNRAYEIYRSRNPNHSPKGLESRTFRDSFSHSDVKIKFLGLWDTVGAHGLPSLTIGKGFEYLKLYDQNVSKKVKHAYQVLAIHERSAFFEPCRIFRRCARCEELLRICEECERTKLEEVWFPGDHLEIGGGIFSVNREISDESLYWMLQRILRTGGLLSKEPLEGGELDQRLAELKERLVTIKKIPKPLSTSLKQRALPLFPFFTIKRASAAMPLMRRDRTIPIRRDEKGMLTFDQLYNGGDWKFEKFRSIRDIKVHEHKKPDSLVRFYTLMEDILIEELKTSGGVNGGGMKTEYQRNMEVAVKKMHYEKGDDDETNKHVSRNIEDGKIEKIERINSVISNIKSFDARTISKFNFDRIIHRYQCNETGCTKCNLYTNHY